MPCCYCLVCLQAFDSSLEAGLGPAKKRAITLWLRDPQLNQHIADPPLWDQHQDFFVGIFSPNWINGIQLMNFLLTWLLVNGIKLMHWTPVALPGTSRANPGLEDGDSKEGRSAVLNENVHGIQALFHLQDEVWFTLYSHGGSSPVSA